MTRRILVASILAAIAANLSGLPPSLVALSSLMLLEKGADLRARR